MRNLILNRDLRQVFLGASAVTVVGLLLGGFMHPTLKGPDALGGPQQQMGVAAARGVYAPDIGATWASYTGQVPDYVIGTDATRPPPEARDDPVVVVDLPEEPQADTGEQVDVVQTAWQDPPRAPTRYPSMSGNTPNESDLPPPPEPPDATPAEPTAG